MVGQGLAGQFHCRRKQDVDRRRRYKKDETEGDRRRREKESRREEGERRRKSSEATGRTVRRSRDEDKVKKPLREEPQPISSKER